jgi:hypothetical protein
MRFARLLWRLLRGLLLMLAALWFLFEEFGWHPLAAFLGRFARWGPWARLEGRVAALPPRRALFVFMVPVALLLPVKLLAVELIHGGRPVAGLLVILAAKLTGTAIGGRIFLLTRPQLMQIRRFARLMAWWRLTRRSVRRAIEASRSWRVLKVWRARLRAHFRS